MECLLVHTVTGVSILGKGEVKDWIDPCVVIHGSLENQYDSNINIHCSAKGYICINFLFV